VSITTVTSSNISTCLLRSAIVWALHLKCLLGHFDLHDALTRPIADAVQSKANVGMDCGGRSDNAQPVQQQQQPVISDPVEELLHMLTNNTATGAAAAAAAAASNLGSLQQPHDQQGPAPQPAGFQVPHQQQQQVQQPSPVQQVLAGRQTQWSLLSPLEDVLRVLGHKGLSGLTVLLDRGCFAKTYAGKGIKVSYWDRRRVTWTGI
jgi:hypothetical protein